ncbi:MAG: (d)CMP kinase [Verrucomicrobiota bacterium]
MLSEFVIAIDGPAASGKSSVARALASRFGLIYVNTGAMYRAVTWLAVSRGVSTTNARAVVELLAQTKTQWGIANNESTICIDGIDPTSQLVSEAVNLNVSKVATIPEVRRTLVEHQRAYANGNSLVMEGRDIGSVVFPETPYKFYIDASPEVRALRRAKQGLEDSVTARDQVDSTRKTSPLIIAPNAEVIDSSNLTIDGVIGEIVERLKIKGLDLHLRGGSRVD